ncbi:Retrovirus-related Pol polyprotein from transposon TNT 1-94 [Gossypium australe]|uniref:Retrovirus-related Pol polyprotein from transposon TNT 1-94 n=1 Tax=Gossypium australe TaxID=47621 RepID=A0A5B6UUE1_9ROSI|nr:Retrovirus-related Pol polyprotein from transposon TNT 1-94 [Gossypium australe]
MLGIRILGQHIILHIRLLHWVKALPTTVQCQVRDLKTREVLLRESVQHRLYKLHLHDSFKNALPSGPAQCFTTSSVVPLSVWHSRLGHPYKALQRPYSISHTPSPVHSTSKRSTSRTSSANLPDQPPPPASVPCNSHAMVTRSKADIFKPKAYMSTATRLSEDTPADIHEAMCNESWKADVHSKLQPLLQNNTWSLCSLPDNQRAIGCKWLFKKARLVAKGFSQHAGLDFRDTFSLVVRAATIQTILAITVMKGWSLRQVDVNNAFLNGELTKEIYMDQPPGFEESGHNGQKLVCKLNKTLYRNYLLLMAYVDDIVITSSSSRDIDNVVHQLHHKFALKDMGRLNFFLGITVQHTPQELFLNQKKYITKILHKIEMTGAAATPTPMMSTPKLVTFDSSPLFADGHLYHSIVGMLQYMCITRPDLSFCVNKLSQYMNSPSDTHWKAVK